MPDHIHFVIFIHHDLREPGQLPGSGRQLYFPEGYRNRFGVPQVKNLAAIVRGIKASVTQWAKINGFQTPIWQYNYYEHIIRNERALEGIVLYIRENPIQWEIKKRLAQDAS